MQSMQVLVAPEYGNADVLRIEQRTVPQPGSQEVLVRVVTTTVNRTDTGILSGQPFFARLVFGLRRPKRSIVGTEFSGIVESVGDAVADFNVGDRVFGFHDEGTSAHAEYLVASQREALGKIPDGVATDIAAACSEGTYYAMNFLRKVSVSAGSRVLINGVSGSIGSAALQLLKQQGAFVVGVCPDSAFPAVQTLNVDELHGPDFSFSENAEPFDLILDTVGNRPYLMCRQFLKDDGTYGSSELGPWSQNVIFAILNWVTGRRRAIFPIPVNTQGCLDATTELLKDNKYSPLIDRTYNFDQIVDAYRYVVTGQKTGNVLVKISDN